MQVRLITELFDSGLWNLEIGDSGMIFSKIGQEEIRVPFSQLRHFNAEGKGEKLKRFILETKENFYEGVFLNDADADEVVRQIREKSGCYVDIRLDTE